MSTFDAESLHAIALIICQLPHATSQELLDGLIDAK